MNNNKEKIKTELNSLIETGRFIMYEVGIKNNKYTPELIKRIEEIEGFITYKSKSSTVKASYQKWFTKSYNVVKQILPDRYSEFYVLYKDEKRKKNDIDYLTYTISDFFLGVNILRTFDRIGVDSFKAFQSKIEIQITILESCNELIDSKLADIEGVLQYELFENELQAAKDLLKKKYNRTSGALAGITLEIHLAKVCSNHNITFRKKNPTISNFNEELKNNSIIDITTWRLIQRLGDIRNLSVHSKEREPKADEVEDLIRGCEKLISELN